MYYESYDLKLSMLYKIVHLQTSGSNGAMRIMNLKEGKNKSNDYGGKMVAETKKGIKL